MSRHCISLRFSISIVSDRRGRELNEQIIVFLFSFQFLLFRCMAESSGVYEEEMLPASGSGDQATMHQVRCKRNKGSLSATTINEVRMRSYLPPTKLVSLLEKKTKLVRNSTSR